VVFGEEETFCLFHGRVEFDPTSGGSHLDTMAFKAVVEEPGKDDVDGGLAWRECLCDPCRSPVLPVVGGLRMRDFVEKLVNVVKVGLRKTEAKRDDGSGVMLVGTRPARRQAVTFLV